MREQQRKVPVLFHPSLLYSFEAGLSLKLASLSGSADRPGKPSQLPLSPAAEG